MYKRPTAKSSIKGFNEESGITLRCENISLDMGGLKSIRVSTQRI